MANDSGRHTREVPVSKNNNRYIMHVELKSSCFELNFQAACQIQQPVSTKQLGCGSHARFEYSFMT